MRRAGRRCGRVDALGRPRTGSARPAADGRNASAQVSARPQHRPAPRGLIVPALPLASVGLALLTGVEAGGSCTTHRPRTWAIDGTRERVLTALVIRLDQ